MTANASRRTAADKANTENAPLEGQTTVDGTDQPKPEPKPVTTTQEILYAKGDVADKVGMTTQGLANRAGRDPDFPLPTYTNESGTVQLYTKKDIQAIIEHLSRPEKDRLAKLAAALKSL